MAIYKLDEDEIIIFQDGDTFVDGGSRINLILTNKSLIEVQYGFFGGESSYTKMPLLDLKSQKGNPNILIGKSKSGGKRLELYFDKYEKYYRFDSMFGAGKWESAITKAYKSCLRENEKKNKKPFNPAEIVFSPLKNVVNTAKDLSISQKKPKIKKTNKCPKCGADLLGEKGSEVKCEYCGTITVIK